MDKLLQWPPTSRELSRVGRAWHVCSLAALARYPGDAIVWLELQCADCAHRLTHSHG